jgi:hypothetical protein
MYWVDDSGRMWYSGGKATSHPGPSTILSENDENSLGSPEIVTNIPLQHRENNVMRSRKPLKPSRRSNAPCAPPITYDNSLSSAKHALFLEDRAKISLPEANNDGGERDDSPAVGWMSENAKTVQPLVPVILFLVAIVAIDGMVTSLGWNHILRRDISIMDANRSSETLPLLTIADVKGDSLSNAVDITVHVVCT